MPLRCPITSRVARCGCQRRQQTSEVKCCAWRCSDSPPRPPRAPLPPLPPLSPLGVAYAQNESGPRLHVNDSAPPSCADGNGSAMTQCFQIHPKIKFGTRSILCIYIYLFLFCVFFLLFHFFPFFYFVASTAGNVIVSTTTV